MRDVSARDIARWVFDMVADYGGVLDIFGPNHEGPVVLIWKGIGVQGDVEARLLARHFR